jgi:two-component system sensor histidine kinase DegS
MVASDVISASSVEQALEGYRSSYAQAQVELKEIDALVQQTTAEVERLARRNQQATSRLQELETDPSTAPPQEAREGYRLALTVQQRLFTMRGQLEKLHSDQKNRTEYLELLRSVIEMTALPEAAGQQPEGGRESGPPLVVRIIEAQERERQQLSRQMHDGPAQSLTNLILQAEIAERLFDSDVDQARAELANLKQAVTNTFQKVRGFILNLRPMMLDDLGLVPTLRRYVDGFSENSGVLTKLVVTGKEQRWASHKEVAVFRLIQGLLNNAIEFDKATSVQVHVDLSDDQVRVSIEDDGEGVDLEEALAAPEADVLGWATMRERVEMLGGDIQFESDVGRGTSVKFRLPVP